MSSWPPGVVPITGRSLLIASWTTVASGSGHLLGKTPNRAPSHIAITVACGTAVSAVTPSGKLSGVSGVLIPTITRGGGSSRLWWAATSSSIPFSRLNAPTNRMYGSDGS